MKKDQHRRANLEQYSQAQPYWLFRLVRPLAFLLGILLSLLAIYSYAATVQMVARNPVAILPNVSQWTPELLKAALAGFILPESFFAIYTLVLNLVFTLIFLACGWLILLRRGQDWFGLYLGLLLLAWARGGEVTVSIHSFSTWLTTIDSYLAWLMWPGLFFLLYLFPSGYITPRWARWFAWGFGLVIVYGLVFTYLDNLIFRFLIPLGAAVVGVGGYAQIYRYRHVGPLERQQVKWVMFALLLFATVFIGIPIFESVFGRGDLEVGNLTSVLIYEMIDQAISLIMFLSLPLSIVLAILSYRLWDVDLVIRKTLVYTALTATLALVFFGGVTLLQQVFGRISGTDNSPVAIVISTLMIAALFGLLRRRIQDFIDRRFYRQKYNAEQALDSFTTVARGETNIEQLTAGMLQVVQVTMQPASITLWLRPSRDLSSRLKS
jgi:hypothetical protein